VPSPFLIRVDLSKQSHASAVSTELNLCAFLTCGVSSYTTLIKLPKHEFGDGESYLQEEDEAKRISQCLELAVLLEASADKPGNISRASSFIDTRYEHFLASAVALSYPFEHAARVGHLVLRREIHASSVGLGQIIKDCVTSINAWKRGGNTLLGSVIMLSPIAVAAGMASAAGSSFQVSEMREKIKLLVESTTPEDAVNVYEAIRMATPGGLGSSSKLDIYDPMSTNKILEESVSLYDIFKMAEKYDALCSEWVNNYPITFEVACPCLLERLEKKQDLNSAIVYAFLKVLAEYPDTLIARKASSEKARQVSAEAKEILRADFETPKGKKRLREFDKELRKSSNLLNPGTTADIIASALALLLLGGYRP